MKMRIAIGTKLVFPPTQLLRISEECLAMVDGIDKLCSFIVNEPDRAVRKPSAESIFSQIGGIVQNFGCFQAGKVIYRFTLKLRDMGSYLYMSIYKWGSDVGHISKYSSDET